MDILEIVDNNFSFLFEKEILKELSNIGKIKNINKQESLYNFCYI